MRPAYFTVTPQVDDDGLKPAGTLAAGSIVLNGSLTAGGAWSANEQTGQLVTITSTSAETMDITIVGIDIDGKAATDVVSFSAETGSASVVYFKSITSMSASTASAGEVKIGFLGESVSPTYVVNNRADFFQAALAVTVSGTINCTVQHTFDDIFDSAWTESSATWFSNDDTDLVNLTANQNGNFAFPPRATRLKVNSVTSPGYATYVVVQSS